MTKHGVLTNEGVLMIQDSKWQVMPVGIDGSLVPYVESVADLMKIGINYGLTHLWVHAETGIDPIAPLEVRQGCFRGIIDGWNLLGHTIGKHVKSVYGWPMPKGNALTLIFPQYSGWGQTGRADVPGWGKVATPKQLLVTISYIEKALGIPVSSSPGSTGWDLMKKMHPEWVANFPKVNLENMHFREGARDMVSQRHYNPAEGCFLHKVDENSAYLRSCTFDTFYGVGDPVIDSDGSKYTDKTALKDGRRPGVWYCQLTPGDQVLPNYEKAGKKWLAGTMIRLMRKVGYEVEIFQGWYFPQAHQLMEKWAKFMWECRQSFLDATKWRRDEPRQFARQAMKQIAVCTVGLTSYLQFDIKEESDKHRPDIKMETVARTYEMLFHNIQKFHRPTGKMPLMVYMDALYYVSDTATVAVLAPVLERQKELGGFKYEGCIEITPEAEEILNASTNVSKKLEHLNKIGWVK